MAGSGFFVVNKGLFKGVTHLPSVSYRKLRKMGLVATGLVRGEGEDGICGGWGEALVLELACLHSNPSTPLF